MLRRAGRFVLGIFLCGIVYTPLIWFIRKMMEEQHAWSWGEVDLTLSGSAILWVLILWPMIFLFIVDRRGQ